jgi:hypothetical protein
MRTRRYKECKLEDWCRAQQGPTRDALRDPQAVDLLRQLLQLNPAKRLAARDALRHAWLWADPLPCPAADLTRNLVDSHEFTVKKRRAEAAASGAGGSKRPAMAPAPQAYPAAGGYAVVAGGYRGGPGPMPPAAAAAGMQLPYGAPRPVGGYAAAPPGYRAPPQPQHQQQPGGGYAPPGGPPPGGFGPPQPGYGVPPPQPGYGVPPPQPRGQFPPPAGGQGAPQLPPPRGSYRG